MTSSDKTAETVHCVRIDRDRSVNEHLACLYCHGKVSEVATGDRAKFCDYDPARDPVTFGFPTGMTRHEMG